MARDYQAGEKIQAWHINQITPDDGEIIIGGPDAPVRALAADYSNASVLERLDVEMNLDGTLKDVVRVAEFDRVDPGVAGAEGQLLTVDSSGPVWMNDVGVNVLHPRYGVTGGGDHTAALQTILTENPGKTIVFPPGTYNVTTLNVTGADTHIVLMAGAVLNKTTAFTDGLVVTGANVTISGPGTIQCPAEWNADNTAWTYAVVHVKANGFVADGVKLVNIPKVGIGLRDINNVQVLGCQITGNIPQSYYTGTETGHFGINYDPPASDPKGNVVITGNIIRSCVQGFIEGNLGAGGPTSGLTISGNTFENCRDHGIYLSGTIGTMITGNNFSRCKAPIASTGDYTTVTGNTLTTDGTHALHDVTGIGIRDGSGCIVANNTIKGVSLDGGAVISVRRIVSAGPVRDNIVEGNTIFATGGGAIAIQIGASEMDTDVSGNIVRGNVIKVSGRNLFGLVMVASPTENRGKHNQVIDNTIVLIDANVSYGIYLSYQDYATVRGNEIRLEADAAAAKTIEVVRLFDSSDCRVEGNRQIVTAAWGANIAIRGYYESGTSDYNYVANNHFLYDMTKLTSANAMFTLAANSIRDNNRTTRAWPSHETGAGAPSAARPNGSTYRRTDGVGTADNFYVRRGGAWVGIA